LQREYHSLQTEDCQYIHDPFLWKNKILYLHFQQLALHRLYDRFYKHWAKDGNKYKAAYQVHCCSNPSPHSRVKNDWYHLIVLPNGYQHVVENNYPVHELAKKDTTVQ